jgi:hypothetical protein
MCKDQPIAEFSAGTMKHQEAHYGKRPTMGSVKRPTMGSVKSPPPGAS